MNDSKNKCPACGRYSKNQHYHCERCGKYTLQNNVRKHVNITQEVATHYFCSKECKESFCEEVRKKGVNKWIKARAKARY